MASREAVVQEEEERDEFCVLGDPVRLQKQQAIWRNQEVNLAEQMVHLGAANYCDFSGNLIQAHSAGITCFLRVGELILTAGNDGQIRIWIRKEELCYKTNTHYFTLKLLRNVEIDCNLGITSMTHNYHLFFVATTDGSIRVLSKNCSQISNFFVPPSLLHEASNSIIGETKGLFIESLQANTNHLIGLSNDAFLHIWDINETTAESVIHSLPSYLIDCNSQADFTLPIAEVQSFCLTEKDLLIYASTKSRSSSLGLFFFDLNTKQPPRKTDLPGSALGDVVCMYFSDGVVFVSRQSPNLSITAVEVNSGLVVRQFLGHSREVVALSVIGSGSCSGMRYPASPSSEPKTMDSFGILISASIDETLKTWDITTGICLSTFKSLVTLSASFLAHNPTFSQPIASSPVLSSSAPSSFFGSNISLSYSNPVLSPGIGTVSSNLLNKTQSNELPVVNSMILSCDGELVVVGFSNGYLRMYQYLTEWAHEGNDVDLSPPLSPSTKQTKRSSLTLEDSDWISNNNKIMFDDWTPRKDAQEQQSPDQRMVLLDLEECKKQWFNVEYGELSQAKLSQQSLQILYSNKDTRYYFNYMAANEHLNYLALDPSLGPIIISVDLSPLSSTSSTSNNSSQGNSSTTNLRVIVRTAQGDERAFIPRTNRGRKGIKKALISVFPNLAGVKLLKFSSDDAELVSELINFEFQTIASSNFKFGVLYCKPGQTSEDEMFNNESGSLCFEEFLNLLGTRIELASWTGFRGGLDVRKNTTGTHSVFTKYKGYNVMFHVSTLLPFNASDAQQLERKRHLGNDIVMVVFKEGNQTLNPTIFRTQFIHIWIVIEPVHDSFGVVTHYKINVANKSGVHPYTPYLQIPPIYEKNSIFFRDFLLTKLINAERAALAGPEFRRNNIRTRRTNLTNIIQAKLTEANSNLLSGSVIGSVAKRLKRRSLSIHASPAELSHAHPQHNLSAPCTAGTSPPNYSPPSSPPSIHAPRGVLIGTSTRPTASTKNNHVVVVVPNNTGTISAPPSPCSNTRLKKKSGSQSNSLSYSSYSVLFRKHRQWRTSNPDGLEAFDVSSFSNTLSASSPLSTSEEDETKVRSPRLTTSCSSTTLSGSPRKTMFGEKDKSPRVQRDTLVHKTVLKNGTFLFKKHHTKTTVLPSKKNRVTGSQWKKRYVEWVEETSSSSAETLTFGVIYVCSIDSLRFSQPVANQTTQNIQSLQQSHQSHRRSKTRRYIVTNSSIVFDGNLCAEEKDENEKDREKDKPKSTDSKRKEKEKNKDKINESEKEKEEKEGPTVRKRHEKKEKKDRGNSKEFLHSFTLFIPKKATLYFKAQTEEQKCEWMQALMVYCKSTNIQQPT